MPQTIGFHRLWFGRFDCLIFCKLKRRNLKSEKQSVGQLCYCTFLKRLGIQIRNNILKISQTVRRQNLSDRWRCNSRGHLVHPGQLSGCQLTVKLAPHFNCHSPDPFPPFQDRLSTPEVDISRRQVVQALVVSVVIVVIDECRQTGFHIPWQIVVLQQHLVFHRAMVTFDLALCHRMVMESDTVELGRHRKRFCNPIRSSAAGLAPNRVRSCSSGPAL